MTYHWTKYFGLQGRNQDLNLAQQKYEIVTGRKNPC